MVAYRSWLKKSARRLGVFNRLRDVGVRLQALRGSIHDPEYLQLPRSLNGKLLVDVGANLGQSIVSLHKMFPRSYIIAFEPNPTCTAPLRRLALSMNGAVEVHHLGVGEFDGELTFNVPELFDGVELLQEGSFDSKVFSEEVTVKRIGEPFKLRTIQIPVRRLDDFSVDPALIKIDVQGFEMQVLYGATETISRSRPVLFVERDRRTEDEMLDFLGGLGYERRILDCNVIFFPDN